MTDTTMVTPHGFQGRLAASMGPTDTSLPLVAGDAALLASSLGQTHHAWLTVYDPTGSEVVRATAWGGQILVERGQDGSTPRTFPPGSCVDARVTYAGVKDLMCNYSCCDTGDCP